MAVPENGFNGVLVGIQHFRFPPKRNTFAEMAHTLGFNLGCPLPCSAFDETAVKAEMPSMDKPYIPPNKGRAQGQKKKLSPKEVEAVKTYLTNKGWVRDLALFSMALDTLLRASDLLGLRVSDVQDAGGNIRCDFSVKQRKIKSTLPVRLHETTRAIVAKLIAEKGKGPSDFLFTSHIARPEAPSRPLTRRHYANLVKKWAKLVGIEDIQKFSTHSLRRTRAAHIYEKTNNDLETVRRVLGHKSLSATSAYLGSDDTKALDVADDHHL